MERDEDPPPPTDVLLVGPETAGGGNAVLRRRDERVEIGELRAVKEGQPLGAGGEMVRLKKRPEHDRLFDVEVLASLPGPDRGSGPPQVATEAYRAGWEVIFGAEDGEDGEDGDLN